MTVAELLAASRAAHLQKKHAAGRVDKQGVVIAQPNYPKAEGHIAEALRLRREAHALDPDQMDSAWQIDRTLNGCDSETLMRFFEKYPTIP